MTNFASIKENIEKGSHREQQDRKEEFELRRTTHRRRPCSRQERRTYTDTLPARAQRLPPYRSRKSHLHGLRCSREIPWRVQPSFR